MKFDSRHFSKLTTTNRPKRRVLSLVKASALIVLASTSAASLKAETLAKIGDQELSREALEERLAGPLLQMKRDRHQLIEDGLRAWIEESLVERELTQRGITLEELIAAEVGSKIAEVTQEEVDSWYEENKQRIRQPQSNVEPQIRGFLQQQRETAARQAFLTSLKKKHGVSRLVEPYRDAVSLEGAPMKGSAEAKVTIVEFSDFECPGCRGINPVLDQVREAYGSKVRLAFRQYPLEAIHPRARSAAYASFCAGEQEQFWEMHDALFADPRSFGDEQLRSTAGGLELDLERFDQCMASERPAQRVDADLAMAHELGLPGTPSIFVNGRLVPLGNRVDPLVQIRQYVDQELELAALSSAGGGSSAASSER